MAEIYKEKIRDLLHPRKDNLEVREDKANGIYIKNVTKQFCVSEDEVYELMAIGNKNREVASDNINAKSSRSHALFTLPLTMTNVAEGSSKRGKWLLAAPPALRKPLDLMMHHEVVLLEGLDLHELADERHQGKFSCGGNMEITQVSVEHWREA